MGSSIMQGLAQINTPAQSYWKAQTNRSQAAVGRQSIPNASRSTSQTAALAFLNDTSDLRGALKTALANLTNASTMQATSSSKFISGTANSKAVQADYTLKVSTLAKAQSNTGVSLDNAGHDFTVGKQTLQLTVSQVAMPIQFQVEDGDTNQISMAKMADAINNAKMGITASIVDDGGGKSHLVVTSDMTGENHAFKIEGTGNAIDVTGIAKGSKNTKAQNATYTINGGVTQISSSNTILLQDGNVRLTLTKAENKDVKIHIGANTDGIGDRISDFVTQFNALLSAASGASDNPFAAQIAHKLQGAVNASEDALQDMGISVDSNGQMVVDQVKLKEALAHTPSKVTDLFGNEGFLVDRTIDQLNRLDSSTPYSLDYVDSSNGATFFSAST